MVADKSSLMIEFVGGYSLMQHLVSEMLFSPVLDR
jgi:hypothetical protein